MAKFRRVPVWRMPWQEIKFILWVIQMQHYILNVLIRERIIQIKPVFKFTHKKTLWRHLKEGMNDVLLTTKNSNSKNIYIYTQTPCNRGKLPGRCFPKQVKLYWELSDMNVNRVASSPEVLSCWDHRDPIFLHIGSLMLCLTCSLQEIEQCLTD